jgi:TRAP-type C4-dicarboxylate transport system permease small subunit
LVSRTGMQRTAALGLPMSWIYLSLTVGSVLMLVGLFLSAKFPPEQPADEIPELPTT